MTAIADLTDQRSEAFDLRKSPPLEYILMCTCCGRDFRNIRKLRPKHPGEVVFCPACEPKEPRPTPQRESVFQVF